MSDLDYNSLTKKGKGMVNELVLNRMDIPVTQLIADAANEADLASALDEIDSQKAVDPRIKMWTARVI